MQAAGSKLHAFLRAPARLYCGRLSTGRPLWQHGLDMRARSALLLAAAVAFLATWHPAGLRARDFLALVHDALARLLPEPLRDHRWRVRFSLLQVYFEQPAVHYEVWVQRKTGRIEVGLHFEGEQEANYRWAAALAGRALEIQAALGAGVELEEWTRSWTRLHETLPLAGDLTPELAEELAQRVAQYIETLEPILAEERAAVG